MPTRHSDAVQSRTLALVLLILAAVTVGYIWWSEQQRAEYVECQAEWGDRLTAAQIAADEAALQDRQLDRREIRSVVALIEDVLDDDTSNDNAIRQWRESIAQIDAERAEVAAERADSPLPSPPSQVCGGR